MRLFERIDAALSAAGPDDYVIALEWQGVEVRYATLVTPDEMRPPTILIVKRPKRLEEEELMISNPTLNGPPFQITREQLSSLRHKYEQHPDGAASFEEFKNRAKPGGVGTDRYVLIHWCGMWLGIEPDGHTHS